MRYRAGVRRVLTGCIATACLAAPPLAVAAPGDLDPSFSGDGWTRTLEVRSPNQNYLPRAAEDVAVQPDGRIVAVGELIDGTSNWYFGTFRYMPDGGLDPSFGEGGWVDTDFGSHEFAHSVAVAPDGGIVVAGEGDCGLRICLTLIRYRPDGSLDTGFGQGGLVQTLFDRGGEFNAVAIGADGKIVAAGSTGGSIQRGAVFAIARYLPDGRPDSTFSRDGRTVVNFREEDDIAHAVALGPRGSVVVAGESWRWNTSGIDFAFARLRGDGKLDRSFSGDGRKTVNFGGRRLDVAYGVALRGRAIVAAGRSGREEPGATPSVAIVRLTARGAVDRRLGRRLTRPGPFGGLAHAILLQPDGRVVVAGRAFEDSSHRSSNWALLRYLRSGRLDSTFGHRGIVASDFGTGEDSAHALALHQGKILAAGSVYQSQALARYLP